MWATSLRILDDVDSNPIRCSAKNHTQLSTYFENISRAMAIICNGLDAFIMDLDIHDVYMSSIWGLVEFPRLARADNRVPQKVNHIQATNPPGNASTTFWDIPGTKTRRNTVDNSFITRKEKREECGVGADIAA
jgi:hypothetical protein